MCYSGKFIDRNPDLKAAGVPYCCQKKVKDSFQVFPRYELAREWFKATRCPIKKATNLFKESPILPNETVHDVLTPELQKSHFVKFREQFFEDLYLKKPELGKATQVHSIPDHITNENTVFGVPTTQSDSLYDLMLPPKSVAQVNQEYTDWHKKYIISHHHYFPGERIFRGYNEYFSPEKTFGMKTNCDLTGGQVRKTLPQNNQVILVKELQKYYLDKTFGEFGRKIHKYHDKYLTDSEHVYGQPPNSNKCRLKDIVQNIEPCEYRDKQIEAIAHLHQLRHTIHSCAQYDIFGLEMELEFRDTENTGYIPLSVALETAHRYQLHFNNQKVRDAFIFYKLLENIGQPNERIRIEDFLKALQLRYLLPQQELNSNKVAHDLDTTYRQFCRDRGKPKPEGITYRKKPIDDGDDGIQPEMFDSLREKEQLMRIFVDIVKAGAFEKVWEIAMEKLKPETNLISINDFRTVLREIRAQCKEGKF